MKTYVVVLLCVFVVLGASALALHLTFFLPAILSVKKKRPVRVYMDDCFDMMHYGHCNALRHAHTLGDELIIGVISNIKITANKGPPVTPIYGRLIMVSAVKWVDQNSKK